MKRGEKGWNGVRNALRWICMRITFLAQCQIWQKSPKTKENQFFTGSGGRLFVMAGHHFFLVPPPLAYIKKLCPPPVCLRGKNSGSPLGFVEKKFGPPSLWPSKNSGPPFCPLKKLVPPFDHPKEFWSPHKQPAHLPVKSDSSLIMRLCVFCYREFLLSDMLQETEWCLPRGRKGKSWCHIWHVSYEVVRRVSYKVVRHA